MTEKNKSILCIVFSWLLVFFAFPILAMLVTLLLQWSGVEFTTTMINVVAYYWGLGALCYFFTRTITTGGKINVITAAAAVLVGMLVALIHFTCNGVIVTDHANNIDNVTNCYMICLFAGGLLAFVPRIVVKFMMEFV